MNILIITGIYPPDIGGPARYVPAIARVLAQHGHTVSVVTLSDSISREHDNTCPFTLHRIRRGLPRLWRMCLTVWYILRYGRRSDVLYVNGLALEAALANLVLGKPVVQKIVGDLAWERARSLHGVSEGLEAFQKKRYTVVVELTRKLRTWWVTSSDCIIVPSRYLQRIVGGWSIPPEKIRVIYNALESPATAQARQRQEINGRRCRIASAGRLVPWKGFDRLIAVAARMPDVTCLIAGEGPERPYLESLISRHGLQSRVRLTGLLDGTALRELLAQADIFVLNSDYEGLPHIVLEAMQVGVPVIATDTGGTGELVRHAQTGLLIPSGDDDALQRAIEQLCFQPGLAAELVAQARAALERFSWQHLVRATEQVLHETRECRVFRKEHRTDDAPLPVLFISTTRYADPPDPTLLKKWAGLRPFFAATVIGFGSGRVPRQVHVAGSCWHLVRARRVRIVRYAEFFLKAFGMTAVGVLCGRYRAVIAQSPYEALAPALALLPMKLLRMRSRPRLIVEIHSDWKHGVMLYHRYRLAAAEKTVRRVLGAFSLACADSFRVISAYCRDLLPRTGTRPVFLFPTYTDPESFTAPDSVQVAQVAARHPGVYFLFAGMLLYLKGLEHLLRAFRGVCSHYPDTRLLIAGTGPELQRLQALARSLGIDGSVLFTGYLEQQVLAAHIACARALVMPSLTEGLGRVAMEAQLLERPVIGSRVGGIPEIVEHEHTGILCSPGDEQALSAAMLRLLADPDLAERMGRAGRQRSAQVFDYSTYFQAYADMVRQTVDRTG